MLVEGLSAAILLLLCLILRTVYVIRRTHAPKSSRRYARPLSLVIVLGSGGHTAEMVRLLTALEFKLYTPRLYLVSSGDVHSARLAHELESHLQTNASEIPRARRVHQPLLTTPLSTLLCLRACLKLFLSLRHDVVLMNGPGTCVPVCLAVLFAKTIARPAPRLVYVESLARTTRLSLTARLARPLVDQMLVQWPTLAKGNKRGWLAECEYKGWLV